MADSGLLDSVTEHVEHDWGNTQKILYDTKHIGKNY